MNHLTTEQFVALADYFPTNTNHPMAVEHLHQCTECQMKLRSFQLLQADLKSMEIPEVSPGFAIRVTAKVRAQEAMRIFNKPAFRIFRWTLAFSLVSMVGMIISILYGNPINVPRLQIPAVGYYLTFAICLVLIFVFDRSLSRLSK